MLTVTLPPIYDNELLEEVIENPLVDEVRYNTGIDHMIPALDILAEISRLTTKYRKPPCWIDLKGRQLRVIEWAAVPFGSIKINHRITATLPAKVYLRGEAPRDLKQIIDGNILNITPAPNYDVGNGQSVNIVGGDSKTTDGYFLKKDLEFIEAAKKLGLNRFMFSFAEYEGDFEVFDDALTGIDKPEKILKIESGNGLRLVKKLSGKRLLSGGYRLMAARDDLIIHVGPIRATKAAKEIVKKDPGAICASRLLMGLETCGEVTLADVSDLELMRSLGYKHFMLSDGISQRHFRKAIAFWAEYKKS